MRELRFYFVINLVLILIVSSTLPAQPHNQDTTVTVPQKQPDIKDSIQKLIEKHYLKKNETESDTLSDKADKPQQAKADSSQTAAGDTTVGQEISPQPELVKVTPSITINNNEEYTKSRDVKLKIFAPKAFMIKVSNQEDFRDAEWHKLMPLQNWTVSEENGYKRVYLKVFYPDSSESDVYFDEIILDMTPPTVKFSVSPDSGIAGETLFAFDATESSHNFEIFLRWDWENDGSFDTYWNVSKEEVYTYETGGGKKTIKLEVKDSGGWLVSSTYDICVFSRPKATFSYTQNFENPRQITFDASASYDFEDGERLVYRWDFNFEADSLWDTDWSDTKRIIHDYENIIAPIVRFEVKDSHGLTNTVIQNIKNKYENMVFIPAANFMMGSDLFDIDERPLHSIFLQEYWIDQFPVTNSQYAVFLNATTKKDFSQYLKFNADETKIIFKDSIYISKPGFEDHPVVNVSWYGAKAFAAFYSKDLPTEAEWEKAARGTDERLYPWGNEIETTQANFWDSGDPFDNNTTPVGFFDGENKNGYQTKNSASPYNIYDLVDNVREWCNDWYQRDYYSFSPVDNPSGPASGQKKVVRGGGYLFREKDLRTTFRSSFEPSSTSNNIGFRCVIRKK